jgi:hypothetical protein
MGPTTKGCARDLPGHHAAASKRRCSHRPGCPGRMARLLVNPIGYLGPLVYSWHMARPDRTATGERSGSSGLPMGLASGSLLSHGRPHGRWLLALLLSMSSGHLMGLLSEGAGSVPARLAHHGVSPDRRQGLFRYFSGFLRMAPEPVGPGLEQLAGERADRHEPPDRLGADLARCPAAAAWARLGHAHDHGPQPDDRHSDAAAAICRSGG